MATKNTTFKFTDTDLELIDGLAQDMGCSRTQALRLAVRELRRSRDLYFDSATAFLRQFKARFPEYATLTVQLDENFDPVPRIDGEIREDIYAPTEGVVLTDGRGYQGDFVRAYLGDPDSDVRILLGLLPLQSGVSVVVPLEDLTPDMSPRAVAYTATGQ